MTHMVMYMGTKRETVYATTPHREEHEIGAAQCTCPECGGDGDWTKFYPHPEELSEPMQCVECKGTGRIWVGL